MAFVSRLIEAIGDQFTEGHPQGPIPIVTLQVLVHLVLLGLLRVDRGIQFGQLDLRALVF